jgi:hypothetical protein
VTTARIVTGVGCAPRSGLGQHCIAIGQGAPAGQQSWRDSQHANAGRGVRPKRTAASIRYFSIRMGLGSPRRP